jgi:hypothetical protein
LLKVQLNLVPLALLVLLGRRVQPDRKDPRAWMVRMVHLVLPAPLVLLDRLANLGNLVNLVQPVYVIAHIKILNNKKKCHFWQV